MEEDEGALGKVSFCDTGAEATIEIRASLGGCEMGCNTEGF